MKTYLIRATIFITFLLVLNVAGQVSPDISSQISAIENEISKARQEKVHLISPENFQKAVKYLEEAVKDYKKGNKISKIQKNLEKSARFLRLAKDLALQGRETFRLVLAARDDALIAGATDLIPEDFQKSEAVLFEAGHKLERGDLKGAQKKAAEAEVLFRKAELKAIKENIVGPVRDMLNVANEKKVDDYAPLTLHKAQDLYQKVLEILNSNRYAKSNARQIAEEAAYEARHAIFLANVIKELRKDDSNWELLIHDFEGHMDHIAEELGFTGYYDKGFTKTVDEIILAIKNLKEENRSLKEDLRVNQSLADSLSAKIQKYERTVLTELEKKKEWEEKLRKVGRNFTSDEAEVFLSGKQMIIRLYALTFPSGKSTILPEHFMLLTKVMRALRVFPNNKVTVTGHTDAQGNDSFNQRLSEERAAAVRAYLEANMGLQPDQIQSIGFGESKPIASNETPEGRKLNRRIEIIIELDIEDYSAN